MSPLTWGLGIVLVVAVIVCGVQYAVVRLAMRREDNLPGNLGQPVAIGFDGSRDGKALVFAGRSRDVVVRLVADTSGFEKAMRRAARAFDDMKRQIGEVMLPSFKAMTANLVQVVARWDTAWRHARVVKLAGLEARYYVRGGLDYRYADADKVCELVREILAGRHDVYAFPFTLTRADRAYLATQVMSAWVKYQDPHRPRTEGTYAAAVEPPGHRYVRSLVRWHDWGRSMVEVDNLMTGHTYQGWSR